MKEMLFTEFVEYVRENNPDLLFSLQGEGSLVSYINQKLQSIDGLLKQLAERGVPNYRIQEIGMNALTQDLRPSRYHFIKAILEEEFLMEYHHLVRTGLLLFEIINILSECDPLFETFGFVGQEEADKNLRYTITGVIKETVGKCGGKTACQSLEYLP